MVYAIQMWQSVVIEYKLPDVILTIRTLQIEKAILCVPIMNTLREFILLKTKLQDENAKALKYHMNK